MQSGIDARNAVQLADSPENETVGTSLKGRKPQQVMPKEQEKGDWKNQAFGGGE